MENFRTMNCTGCQCNGCYECQSANCDICYRAEFADEHDKDWIPVAEQMPKEHDSMFAKYKGTDKWDRFMFEKISHDVLATVEDEKGNRHVRLAHTIDGKWGGNIQIRKLKVIAWMPLPEPYKQHIAEGGENNDI